MDVVGSEIGQKMRSAIKAKLTELGCYVDDELPDYVMVMVANKRTRAQMEDDLQLFLGENTESFVNWLHQVLKKLQEVTVPPAITPTDPEKVTEKSQLKEKKSKDKKAKDKTKKIDGIKKLKKKDKSHRKKEERKAHKSKKKSKHHEMIRPNVPPLLMNIEKESEPSITDVFAGQILKNHGITIDVTTDTIKIVEKKPDIEKEVKRPIVPIIDPATITSHIEPSSTEVVEINTEEDNTASAPRDEQIKEINEIELKIQGLKQKLAEQLDSMSEDEDFLNIRTEAEELMNDFAEDVFQEISQTPVVATPPISCKSPIEPPSGTVEVHKEIPKDPIELPQIELKLPKRPVRERLGLRDEVKKTQKETTEKRIETPERLLNKKYTPDRDFLSQAQTKSAKSRHSNTLEAKKSSVSEENNSEKFDTGSKRLTSKVSVLENRTSRANCASVVRVRPRPRVNTPASSLLMRAVADAHKSLLNIPPKVDAEPSKIKRALVLPMRRTVDAQKIVIQVPVDSHTDSPGDDISLGDMDSDDDKSFKISSDGEKEEYIPAIITKKFKNTDYVPSRKECRTSTRRDDTLIVETINIHHTTVDKDKNTQFIVTMDGYHPNAFLAKKLMTEGLLADDDEIGKTISKDNKGEENNNPIIKEDAAKDKDKEKEITPTEKERPEKKRKESTEKLPLSNTSDESNTQVIVKQEDCIEEKSSDKKEELQENITEKRKSNNSETELDSPPVKKRRGSPIVFDVDKKKVVEKQRERTESVSSDNHVTIATTTNTHKYDALPPLSTTAVTKREVVWCRAFPLCRYGSMCAFTHPRCKFAAACTRRNCPYSHSPAARAATAPLLASHVVPAANYKSISGNNIPGMCKYYPSCVNPTCHYYHPKPCRYGKACTNKLECNFYHNDVPTKWNTLNK